MFTPQLFYDYRARNYGAYIPIRKLMSNRRLTPVHARRLPDMASRKDSTVKCQVGCSRRPQDRCPAAMISILMSLDSLMKSTHNSLGTSTEQVSSRLLFLWKRNSFPFAKKLFSGTPHREILSSDLSSNAFPDSTAQLDGTRLSKEDGNCGLTVFTTGYCMDSCDSDGLFPL